uniref:Beta-lactoglobulin n=1 Tax=Talaromyces marneffei PM1 TaxID=1077442 RepID=A0A093XMH5_TALMA
MAELWAPFEFHTEYVRQFRSPEPSEQFNNSHANLHMESLTRLLGQWHHVNTATAVDQSLTVFDPNREIVDRVQHSNCLTVLLGPTEYGYVLHSASAEE